MDSIQSFQDELSYFYSTTTVVREIGHLRFFLYIVLSVSSEEAPTVVMVSVWQQPV